MLSTNCQTLTEPGHLNQALPQRRASFLLSTLLDTVKGSYDILCSIPTASGAGCMSERLWRCQFPTPCDLPQFSWGRGKAPGALKQALSAIGHCKFDSCRLQRSATLEIDYANNSPEGIPNACLLCGSIPSVVKLHDENFQVFCYEHSRNHALMVSGITRLEAVQRWNVLNPKSIDGDASHTPFLQRKESL